MCSPGPSPTHKPPERPITGIVHAAARRSSARRGDKMGELLGEKIVVDTAPAPRHHRTGRWRKRSDGYTCCGYKALSRSVVVSTRCRLRSGKILPHRHDRQRAELLVVYPVSVQTLAELILPKAIRQGNSARPAGTPSHITAKFWRAAGSRGSLPPVLGQRDRLLGGHIPMAFAEPASHSNVAGQLRALAVTSAAAQLLLRCRPRRVSLSASTPLCTTPVGAVRTPRPIIDNHKACGLAGSSRSRHLALDGTEITPARRRHAAFIDKREEWAGSSRPAVLEHEWAGGTRRSGLTSTAGLLNRSNAHLSDSFSS